MFFGTVTSICSRPAPDRLFYGLLPVALGAWVMRRAACASFQFLSRRRYAWLPTCVLAVAAGFADFIAYRQLREVWWERTWIAVVWDERSATLDWGGGRVAIPAGFRHEALSGMDTQVGEFRSTDGSILIRYDIGELAGEHGGLGRFRESLTDGYRVRMSLHKNGEEEFAAVSFPDAGCANFFTSSSGGAVVIQSIGSSFHPTRRLPAWLVRILPEGFRSDCHYRCENWRRLF